MDLVTFREYMIEKVGRLDLVVDDVDYVDNGADQIINTACRMLDRLINFDKSEDRQFHTLDAGDYYIEVTNCRQIDQVWVNNATGRSQLTRKDMDWLKEEFSAPIASTDSGTPLYWTPARLRSTVTTALTSPAAFFNHIKADSWDYRGIVILGPADEELGVEIVGQFYSDVLSLDADENYWTVMEPDLLVNACLYRMEVLNRNLSGANELMFSIQSDIRLIDQDQVMEDNVDIIQIGG